MFGTIYLRMYTDEELSAPYTLPLPARDDIEDAPPFTQATDGLDIEPNQAPLDWARY